MLIPIRSNSHSQTMKRTVERLRIAQAPRRACDVVRSRAAAAVATSTSRSTNFCLGWKWSWTVWCWSPPHRQTPTCFRPYRSIWRRSTLWAWKSWAWSSSWARGAMWSLPWSSVECWARSSINLASCWSAFVWRSPVCWSSDRPICCRSSKPVCWTSRLAWFCSVSVAHWALCRRSRPTTEVRSKSDWTIQLRHMAMWPGYGVVYFRSGKRPLALSTD